MSDTWPGWEDSAVAPDRLGDYLRDLRTLFDEFGYSQASLYGHFGQGCVHTRIPFDLRTADGVARFREFVERAADLVVVLRRLVLGRARRRPGARRAAAEDVRPRGLARVRTGEGDLRSRRSHESRQGRRALPARHATSASASTTSTPRADTAFAYPTTTAASGARCCVASASGSAAGRAAASCARRTW